MDQSIYDRNALSVSEMAKYMKKSRNTIYKWMEEGLPYRRLGPKTVFILKSDVEEFIKKHKPI